MIETVWDVLHDTNTWRSVTLGAGVAGQTWFLAMYVRRGWYKSGIGKVLFFKGIMLAAILWFAFLSRTFRFGDVDEWFVPFYALLAVGIWAQAIVFRRVMKRGDAQAVTADDKGREA